MQKTFDAAIPLYVASGLLTYDGSKDFLDVQEKLKAWKVCDKVYYKELFLYKEVFLHDKVLSDRVPGTTTVGLPALYKP
ncbi:hypothetical protein COCOBI_19-1990 [Coccomyxa sp. Obi]|nr:hypothetical protein COCOBI_19-1990 [Coccomyxa sp. Obi]